MTRVVARTLMRVAAALLGILDGFLQVVIPRRHRRVCYFSVPDYADNAYHLFRHTLRTREGIDHVWLVRDARTAVRIEDDFLATRDAYDARAHTIRVLGKNTLRGYLAYLSSRVTFHTHGVYSFSKWAFRREVVCLWHGIGIKGIDRLNTTNPDPKRPFGTVHIATSHLYKYIIACATGVEAAAVRVCGNPRCDALVFEESRTTTGDQVRERLDLPPAKRLVLWLPTFRVREDPWESFAAPDDRTRSSGAVRGARSFLDNLPDWALPALDEACRQHDCFVVIKLHPLDSLNRAPELPAYDHIRLVTAQSVTDQGIPLYDLLGESDGLLSDLSSVVVDYLVTGRPIGLIAVAPDSHSHDLLFPPQVLLENAPFRDLTDPEALQAFVQQVASGGGRPDRCHDGRLEGIAPLLYERFSRPSSDLVLEEVRL